MLEKLNEKLGERLVTGSFNCTCGYSVITDDDALLLRVIQEHPRSCPGVKRTVWSYLFSDEGFFIAIGLSAIAWAMSSWFH